MNSYRQATWLLAGLLSLALIVAGECNSYRLKRSVLPTFYDLTISLRGDADNPSTIFDGEVNITLKTQQVDVRQITLHKDEIDIRAGVGLYNSGGNLVESIANTSLTYDKLTQQLTVHLAQALAVNESYKLHFKYTGKVHSDMTGLFSSSVFDKETGKTKWMALTQLQRIYARLVFPCFDEPRFKAKFQLHIGRSSGVNAISNTKLISTTDEGNNRFMDHFDVTPLMSTYLLAFMVFEYQARGSISDFAVVTRPEAYNKTQFSHEVGQRVLAAYGDLFQRNYTDLGNQVLLYASSPRFPHGGMENWGLIIYRDNMLIHDPGYTDGWVNKELTIRILAHETSHMWFGDSVTFKWWSSFWLNEAFARFYEYFMAHQLYPEYQLDEQFVVRQVHLIFATDATAQTQPMTSPEASIQTPAEIASKFSSITYAKGASIVRMWRNAMGGPNFEKAIQKYIKHHHLGNTQPQNLFTHLKKYWPAYQTVDLDQFFYDFTEQMGFPTITVNISSDNHMVTLRQHRFLLNPDDGSDANIRYTVPITYTTNLAPNFQNLTPPMYFAKSLDKVHLEFTEPVKWIVFNLKQSNYYRVFYDTALLQRLKVALAETGHSTVAVENRAQIIDDLFNFAHIESIDYVNVFEFMEYMKNEVDYIPWYAAYVGMTRVAKRLTPELLPHFGKYLSKITAAVHAKLNVSWSAEDSVLDVYNRNQQVAWLCKYQNKDCNDKVRLLFQNSFEKPTPDYRESFYCAVSRSGGYARVLEFFKNETDSNEQKLLWRAASCTRDYRAHYQNEILGSTNSVSLKTSGIAQLYEQNPDMITNVFIMITEDIEQLANALDSWPTTAKVLGDLADFFTSREQQSLFTAFIDKNSLLFGSSVDVLTKALTTVDDNVMWAERRLDRLAKYLSGKSGAAGIRMATTMLSFMASLIMFS